MATEVKVPALGESVTEATVAQWFKKAGDQVNVDEPLVELETDKVTVEVPGRDRRDPGDDRRRRRQSDGETCSQKRRAEEGGSARTGTGPCGSETGGGSGTCCDGTSACCAPDCRRK